MNAERFKNGDVIFSKNVIAIIASIGNCGKIRHHCYYHARFNLCLIQEDYGIGNINDDGIRLATEEEKQKLFDAIKSKGYKWNKETKTLEKLPKFKVGDRVKHISTYVSGTVVKVGDKGYHIDYPKGEGGCYISFALEKDYELVPNKFDITTLVSYESRVLVRNENNRTWRPALFGCYIKNHYDSFYVLGGTSWKQCIPYEGNEHLRGTTNDCDDFYKTWE